MKGSPATEALAVRLTELEYLLEVFEAESRSAKRQIENLQREMEAIRRQLQPAKT